MRLVFLDLSKLYNLLKFQRNEFQIGKNMALISCPECTHTISDQSVSCTNCGLPTSKMRLSIKCPECFEFTTNQNTSCANCGFPIGKPVPSKDIPPSYEELKRVKERNLDKAFEELEELEEYRESKWIEHTLMFIISCIIIYLISKEEIHYILQSL